jgi:hypothetical protein
MSISLLGSIRVWPPTGMLSVEGMPVSATCNRQVVVVPLGGVTAKSAFGTPRRSGDPVPNCVVVGGG